VVDGVVDGVLRVRVAAPPADDAANRALVRLLAHELDVPVSAVHIVAGARGRAKILALHGVDRASLAARWPGLRLPPTG
jgi:uncharacterized protein YggU (UPF0235/DUF167 family)